VTTLDWIIVAFTVVLALYGFLQGFIVGALSLLGFAVGAVLGARFGPALLPGGNTSPYAPLFGLLGTLIAGAILAGGLEGVGTWIRRAIRIPGLGVVDGVLGGLLTACVALGMAWIGGAVALQTPGLESVRADVRKSEILNRLNSALPPSGPILHALARFDPLPKFRGSPPRVAAPTRAILRDPEVRAASQGVVRVLGTACGLGISGSGWSAGNGLVVTNAHVVAGEEDTTVQLRGVGPRLDAVPVRYDPTNDIAVLRVSGLNAPTLPLADAQVGGGAAVLGFPMNGPFDAHPARLGVTRTAATQDAYGRAPVQRRLLSFRGLVRHGNSGGPLVDGQGRVAGTVFAAVVGGATRGGYAVPDEIVRRELAIARGSRRVSTGPCSSG
jgi:S1-C subfamily serine protease